MGVIIACIIAQAKGLSSLKGCQVVTFYVLHDDDDDDDDDVYNLDELAFDIQNVV